MYVQDASTELRTDGARSATNGFKGRVHIGQRKGGIHCQFARSGGESKPSLCL